MDGHRRLIQKSALKYLSVYGVSVIPLGLPIKDGMPEKQVIDHHKRPDRPWSQWQTRQATPAEVESWHSLNLGLVTGAISGVIVVDCESPEDARWFWRERGKANCIVQTPRGYHMYFQTPGQHVPNAQRIEGKYDIRGDGGYVVCPPSIVNGKQYRFLEHHSMCSPLEMVKFRMEWRYPKGGEQQQVNTGPLPNEKKMIRDGLAYIKTMHAVSGAAGHKTTWKACQRLRDSGMSETEALAAMMEWNQTNCDPPWSTAELLHKVKGVYAR